MYDDIHRASPEKPIMSSETSSAVSDRGEYQNDSAGGYDAPPSPLPPVRSHLPRRHETDAGGGGRRARFGHTGMSQDTTSTDPAGDRRPKPRGVASTSRKARASSHGPSWRVDGPGRDGTTRVRRSLACSSPCCTLLPSNAASPCLCPRVASRLVSHISPRQPHLATSRLPPCASPLALSLHSPSPPARTSRPGEPTPYAWPDINSHFGILDIAGFEKDRFYYYRAQTRPGGVHTLHIFPHWNWQTHDATERTVSSTAAEAAHLAPCHGMCRHGHHAVNGSAPTAGVDVWVFTDGASVELFVNGQSHGRVQVSAHAHAQWNGVPYSAGELRAVARDAQGAIIETQVVETTGPAVGLRLSIKDGVGNSTADGHGGGIVAGCGDVALVKVEVVDAKGRVVPTANQPVTLTHTGSGALFIGGGNGDPAEHTADKSHVRPAFHGLLLGIYQATDVAGNVTVHATSPGLAPASLQLRVVAASFESVWWCERLPEL